jgi:NAD(P)-dependent dehydrogenase (short-subunit alcohol dehydrogenase family)
MSGAALVTGAGQRLGRAMALHLARRGLDVAVHYATSRDAAEAVAAEARALGVRAAALRADLLDEAETQALVPAAAAALGRALTVLVNNASIFEYDTLRSATRDSWDRHIGSNLRAPFVLTQRFAAQAPAAVRDAAGEPLAQALVVNLIDQRVLKPTPEFMTYTIAKMGLWAFTRTAAQALAPDIRVNAIGPGPTLQGARQSPEHFARQRAATVLGRGANPDDICAALSYFLDAPAVTGQLLCIDGGQHLGWQTPDVLGPE